MPRCGFPFIYPTWGSMNIFFTLLSVYVCLLSLFLLFTCQFNTVPLAIKALFIFCNLFYPFFGLANFVDLASSSSTFSSSFSNLLLNPFSKIFISDIVLFSSRLSILLYSFYFSVEIAHLFSHHDHASPFRSLNITVALKSANSANFRVSFHFGVDGLDIKSHYPDSSHVQQLSIINWILWMLSSRDFYSFLSASKSEDFYHTWQLNHWLIKSKLWRLVLCFRMGLWAQMFKTPEFGGNETPNCLPCREQQVKSLVSFFSLTAIIFH